MVISQPALVCLAATTDRLRRRLAACGLGRAPAALAPIDAGAPPATVDLEREAAPEIRSPEVVPTEPEPKAEPLSADERRARSAAFRALLLARQRRFVAARAAFAEAARLDPALDLTTVPTFWALERGAHEAAIAAYEETGRRRDALVLAARLEHVYRPRLVCSPLPAVPNIR